MYGYEIPNMADAVAAGFDAQAKLDSTDFKALSSAVEGYGVYLGCAVTAQATPNNTVAVATGTICTPTSRKKIAGGNVAMVAAHASLPRRDIILANFATGALSWSAGTAAADSSTSAPVKPSYDPTTHALLAEVYVPAGDTAISNNQIKSRRITLIRVGDTKVNVRSYGASSGNTGDANSTAIQQAADEAPKGAVLVIPPYDESTYTIYDVLRPTTIKVGTTVQSMSHGSGSGVQVRIAASAAAADWNAKGIFTSETYLNPAATPAGDPIIIDDIDLSGRSLGIGNGVVLMNKFSRVRRCAILGFHGTTLWSPATMAGAGYCIVMSGTKYNSTNQMTTETPEQRVEGCRLASNNARVYIEDGVGQYTDGFLTKNIIIKQPGGGPTAGSFFDLPDIYLASAGGWDIEGNHWNHSGGNSLVIGGCMSCRIRGNYFDSWGHVSNGLANYCIDAQHTNSGGGSNLDVSGNTVRWQDYVDGDAGAILSGILTFLRVRTPTTAAAAGTYYTTTVNGNVGYVQKIVGGPTAKLFDLRGNNANNIPLIAALTGNQFADPNQTDGRWNDANVHGTLPTVRLSEEGNSWQKGTAAPTVGTWAAGFRRMRDTPIVDAAGVRYGWICTVGGTPGTHVELIGH